MISLDLVSFSTHVERTLSQKKIPTCQNVRTIKELFPDDASGTMKNFYEKKFTKITALSYEKKYITQTVLQCFLV